MVQWNMADIATHMALQTMAFHFNYLPRFKKYLKSDDGWINFSLGMRTEEGNVRQCIIFHDGRVRVSSDIPDDVDPRWCHDNGTLKDMASLPRTRCSTSLEQVDVRGNSCCPASVSSYPVRQGEDHQHDEKQAGTSGVLNRERATVAARAHRIRLQLTAPQDPRSLSDDPYSSGYPRRFPASEIPRYPLHSKPAIHECPALTRWFRQRL